MRFTVVQTLIASLLAAGSVAAQSTPPGLVFTMTNDASGNSVHAYVRNAGGYLSAAGHFATGGNGTGASLGSQGSLALSRNQQWLLVVNGGSNQLSVFRITRNGLMLTDTVDSGGTLPVSVTTAGPLAYVVNSGSDSIAGFALSAGGKLAMIPGSIQSLSASGAGPAQIQFNPEGDTLVVTEKNTNMITVFAIGAGGAAMPGQSFPSSGMTPYGFAFAKRRQLIVSEAFGGTAGASAASSYRLRESGELMTISPSVKNTQSASCWLTTDMAGQFAFVSNTGSNTISSYTIDFDGELTLLQAAAAQTGNAPADSALTADGRFLYVHNEDGGINGYAVMSDGSLTPIRSVGGLPASSVGLVAR
ncbi:MAG: beta-propeller fold lactonase family protein [Bryobacteraceae bacterium]